MPAAVLIRLIFWLWFGGAVWAGHAGLLTRLPPPALPALVLMLGTLGVMFYVRIAPLRAWVETLDLRTLILLHLVRFFGVALLVYHAQGRLPFAFAVPAGIGDIAIALFALPVALAPLDPPLRRRAIAIWNVAGMMSILLVLASVFRLNSRQPGVLEALTVLPLSLLPTFLAPFLITTHVVIFLRLSRTP